MALGGRPRVTPVDYLAMEVSALMERTAIRAALHVGESGFVPGYYVILKRRSVEVYYIDDREGNELEDHQAQFATRMEPLLVRLFGRQRVRCKTLGVRRGFEITLK